MWSATTVAVDGAEDIVITGSFYGVMDFGGGPLVSAGEGDIFIAKYNAAGAHLWSQRIGDIDSDTGFALAVDAAGNIYVSGGFAGTVDFGGGGLASAGASDVFLAKYNSSGVHQWSQQFGSTLTDIGRSVTVDPSGDIILAAQFRGTVSFGGVGLVSAGLSDIALAKYNSSGVHQWSERWGGANSDIPMDVAVDGAGDIAVTGVFTGTTDLGGGPLASAGLNDIFLAHYSSGGAHQWSKRFGTAGGNEFGESVAIDASGRVVFTGQFNGTVDFGGGPLVGAGGADIFLAQYDATGSHQWSQRFGAAGSNPEEGRGVAIDASGNITCTGFFTGTVSFGGGSFVSTAPYDIFFARYSSSGVHQWSAAFGGPSLGFSGDAGQSVAIDGLGATVFVGTFASTVNFGGGTLTNPGTYSDVFIVKFVEDIPIPVLISKFDAVARRGSVEVSWDVWSDEALASFSLYRREGDASLAAAVAQGSFDGAARAFVDDSVKPATTYHYELVIQARSGDEFRSPVATVTTPAVAASLGPNHPNPFNPTTTIEYTLSEPTSVVISIFDASGAVVARLDDGRREAGTHSIAWDGRNSSGRSVGSGVYFYRLEGSPEAATRKMVLLK